MFINCTQHNLSEDQLKEALKYSKQIINLKEDNSSLFERLSNTPASETEARDLCFDFINYIKLKLTYDDIVYVHLPIGSPYFMAMFIQIISFPTLGTSHIKLLFSHSERQSVETQTEKGTVKQTMFKFIKFQEL